TTATRTARRRASLIGAGDAVHRGVAAVRARRRGGRGRVVEAAGEVVTGRVGDVDRRRVELRARVHAGRHVRVGRHLLRGAGAEDDRAEALAVGAAGAVAAGAGVAAVGVGVCHAAGGVVRVVEAAAERVAARLADRAGRELH